MISFVTNHDSTNCKAKNKKKAKSSVIKDNLSELEHSSILLYFPTRSSLTAK